MAIADAGLDETRRLQIGWFESDPPEAAARALKGFQLSRVSENAFQDLPTLASLNTVVFVQDPQKLKRVSVALEMHGPKLLGWGCHIVVQAAPSFRDALLHLVKRTSLGAVTWHGKGVLPPYPYVHIYDEKFTWDMAASDLQRIPNSPAPYTSLEIELESCPGHTWKDEEAWLIQRAFFNCERVVLKRLPGGLSGANVFVAHPTLQRTYTGGRRPLPYFVKIDERSKVITEYRNYRERVDPHIPFHLGPQLDRDRCGLGATQGILVGDFIEESESLVDCARSGRAAAPIACLFNRTLHGWHRDAERTPSLPQKFSQGVYRRFPSTTPVPTRGALARRLGARLNVDALNDAMAMADMQEMFVGPIHGDLNAKNVRVRGGDAIIIDFLDHREDGDVLWDAANLEASLFLDGFADSLSQRAALRDVKALLVQLAPMYQRSLRQEMSPPYPEPGAPVSWYYECVRQIRRYAAQWQCKPGQYASLLGRAFLKKAFNGLRFDVHEEHRRAAAYVLAEMVLVAAFGKGPNLTGKAK